MFEERLTEYRDIFAMTSDNYERANRMYHRMDTGEALPIL
jgi:hypothetical protein